MPGCQRPDKKRKSVDVVLSGVANRQAGVAWAWPRGEVPLGTWSWLGEVATSREIAGGSCSEELVVGKASEGDLEGTQTAA